MARPIKTRWRCLGILLITTALGGVGVAQEAAVRAGGAAAAGAVENRSEPEPRRPPTAKNPFAYGSAEDERGLVPADTGRLPHGIRLAAVLIPKEGAAVAVLRLPGESAPVFVREDDLVSIDPRGADPTGIGITGAAARTGAETAPFYLLIKSITTTGVEVAPRVRPTEVHLIR